MLEKFGYFIEAILMSTLHYIVEDWKDIPELSVS